MTKTAGSLTDTSLLVVLVTQVSDGSVGAVLIAFELPHETQSKHADMNLFVVSLADRTLPETVSAGGVLLVGSGGEARVAGGCFCLASIRVNDKPQLTFVSVAGEFRLYVHPEGPKQKWLLPRSMRAKPQTCCRRLPSLSIDRRTLAQGTSVSHPLSGPCRPRKHYRPVNVTLDCAKPKGLLHTLTRRRPPGRGRSRWARRGRDGRRRTRRRGRAHCAEWPGCGRGRPSRYRNASCKSGRLR